MKNIQLEKLAYCIFAIKERDQSVKPFIPQHSGYFSFLGKVKGTGISSGILLLLALPAHGQTTITNSSPTTNQISTSGSGLTTVDNTSSITYSSNAAIVLNGANDVLNNTGSSAVVTGGEAVSLQNNNQNINNSGTLLGTTFPAIDFNFINGITITNTGTISGSGQDIYSYGGTIDTLNNLQGAGNAAGALTYDAIYDTSLTNYNIIINSHSNYGQLDFLDSNSPVMHFGIYSGSTVTAGTYADVLKEVSSISTVTGTTGAYNGMTYSLVADTSNSGDWNLVFVSSIPPVNFRTEGAASIFEALGNGSGAMAGVLAQFSALSSTQQAATLEKVIPLTNRGIQLSTRNSMISVFDRLSLRLDQLRSAKVNGAASGDDTQDNDIWFKPFGGGMNQSAKDSFAGYNGSNWGLAGGIDHHFDGGLTAGMSFTYTKTNINYSDQQTGDTNTINGYQISVYGSKSVGIGYVEAMAAWARQAYASRRNTGLSGTAAGNFDGGVWGLRVGGGIPFAVDGLTTLTPMLRMDWNHVTQNGYGESGAGALDLNIGSLTADRLRGSVGGQILHDADLFGVKTQPYLRAFYSYDFLNSGVNTTSTFAGGGAAFITPGQNLDHSTGTVGAGLNVLAEENLTASLGYDVNFGSGYQAHTAQATLRYRF
jgi:outer membrane autotransporter protein